MARSAAPSALGLLLCLSASAWAEEADAAGRVAFRAFYQELVETDSSVGTGS